MLLITSTVELSWMLLPQCHVPLKIRKTMLQLLGMNLTEPSKRGGQGTRYRGQKAQTSLKMMAYKGQYITETCGGHNYVYTPGIYSVYQWKVTGRRVRSL